MGNLNFVNLIHVQHKETNYEKESFNSINVFGNHAINAIYGEYTKHRVGW